jgi:hypothetical protein
MYLEPDNYLSTCRNEIIPKKQEPKVNQFKFKKTMSMIPYLMMTSRVTEVDGSTARIISAYQTSGLNADPNMEKIFGPLQEKSTLFSEAINRLKAKSEQQTNDEVRDEKIDGVYYLLVSFSHHPDEVIKNAALRLLGIFEEYGLAIKDEGYTTESSLVNSLLNDFSKPEQQADIALVPQCAGYIEALQTAQANFENNRIAYETALGEEGTLENATALKKEIVRIINGLLVPHLNVMSQLEERTYGAFARTVAEIIAGNNEVVKKRRNKEEPDDEAEGTE